MLKVKLLMLYYAMKIATCSCEPETDRGFANLRSESKIIRIGTLEAKVNESSGLATAQNGNYWTHNDSGGQPILYQFETSGLIKDSLLLKNTKNRDWEELASDDKGNLYIGDFGNNSQNRKDLLVYKINGNKTEEIRFSYADQKAFPSETKDFDCEAFFWYKNELHLFTKSWEQKKRITKHYVLPDKAGEYVTSPSNFLAVKEMVTAADISPDGSKFALMTYGKILTFGIKGGIIDFSNPVACIKTRRKQTEAILFKTNNTIIFTNEQGGIFEVELVQD